MTRESCEFPLNPAADETIRKVLKEQKTVAVVGLSSNPLKASHRVAKFLRGKGYTIIPVNPNAKEALGLKSYPRLSDVAEKIDIVNVFRPPSELPAIAEEAINAGAKTIWAQEGIVNNEAAAMAESNGLAVIMGRCIMKDYLAHMK